MMGARERRSATMADTFKAKCPCGWHLEGKEEHQVAHALMDHAREHHGMELSHEKAHEMVREESERKQ
jgi:predicted small metal-binding protein